MWGRRKTYELLARDLWFDPSTELDSQRSPRIIRNLRVLPPHETRVNHVGSRLFSGITEKTIDLPLIKILSKKLNSVATENFSCEQL